MPVRYTGPMFVNTVRKALLLACYCTSSGGGRGGVGGLLGGGEGGGGAVSLPTPVNEGQQGG
jgi:hypothetical protein